jgi:hypothetical protein
MAVIKVELDMETFERLAAVAIDQRRSLPWQAEVILMQALGTWRAKTGLKIAMPHQFAAGRASDRLHESPWQKGPYND